MPSVLTATRAVADYFEETARAAGDPKAASNWMMTEVLAWLNQRQCEISEIPVTPEAPRRSSSAWWQMGRSRPP